VQIGVELKALKQIGVARRRRAAVNRGRDAKVGIDVGFEPLPPFAAERQKCGAERAVADRDELELVPCVRLLVRVRMGEVVGVSEVVIDGIGYIPRRGPGALGPRG